MLAVELRDITKTYGSAPILQHLNIGIEAGTFTVVFGMPTCGKSVLVRLLTGLEKPNSGQIFLRETDVTDVEPGERNIGYVPQSFALYPHYSVHDNIAYPLSLMRVPKDETETAVRQVANQIKIDHLLNKRPDQLSGGEKQRVALARGIIKQTDIYVLDDPLVGLDFKLREQLFDDLRNMQESLQATFVYTTSDPLETLALADQVSILDGGCIVETGNVEQMYHDPQHARSMELLGFPASNMLQGELYSKGGQTWCRSSFFDFPIDLFREGNRADAQNVVDVAIRPQHVMLEFEQRNGCLTAQADITLRDDLGGEIIVYLDVKGTPLTTVISHDKDYLIAQDVVTIGIHPPDVALFSSETGQKIGHGVM
ncbi:sugar ABC transporter ATP-binding protein [candidate division KSB3 bacterium]|uniref:Sugar ABC transporter ATP-binding protein n=1 Tax=candidate division KSB3 bacterium TaxID=2044937 RepID=A0A2G6K871_9BACT|nr:MAG: sugar ABC transporter ATP-binding protein [candidate division KSB3 bacterium]